MNNNEKNVVNLLKMDNYLLSAIFSKNVSGILLILEQIAIEIREIR